MRSFSNTMGAALTILALTQTSALAEGESPGPSLKQLVHLPVSVTLSDPDNGINCTWEATSNLTTFDLGTATELGKINCTNPGSTSVTITNVDDPSAGVKLTLDGTTGNSIRASILTPNKALLGQGLSRQPTDVGSPLIVGRGETAQLSLTHNGAEHANPGKYLGVVNMKVWVG